MKKLLFITGLSVSFFVGSVCAQGTTAATNTTKSKPVSNNPGKASPSAKPAVAKKEPRRAHTSSPELELKPAKK